MTIIADLADAAGVPVVNGLAYDRVEYALVESGVGAATVEGPLAALPPTIGPDWQLRLRRSVYGATPYLEGNAVWLVRSWSRIIAELGERRYRLVAQHATSLLTRRIVDYAAGSAEASKTGPADDLIRAIVRENFVSPTDATRTMSGLTVGADQSAAPSVSKAFAYQQVFSTIQALCAQSAQSGVYLGVEVVPASGGFEVVTFTGQRGMDRSTDGQVVFSLERRTLADGDLTYAYTDQATRIIAGGQGRGSERTIERADDATAQAESPYGLIEGWRQATGAATSAAVEGEAEAGLWQRRARVRFNGTAQQVQGCLYGVNYGWGDIVPVQFEGVTLPCRVATVRNRAQRGAGEQLDIRLSGDTVL